MGFGPSLVSLTFVSFYWWSDVPYQNRPESHRIKNPGGKHYVHTTVHRCKM